jgi:hypothetical protein
MRNAYILVSKPEWKRSFGGPRHWWEENKNWILVK